MITSFWQVIQSGALRCGAEIVLVDVGPSLGAVNRSALIATDCVVVPLAADLYSRQGLRNLGPTLRQWRSDWRKRSHNWEAPEFPLPEGHMRPVGYLIQQHGVRLSRPVQAYDRWVRRMPAEYAASVLGEKLTSSPSDPDTDENAIASVKHYRSLVPLAQDARKPIFSLAPADGAIGSHAAAAPGRVPRLRAPHNRDPAPRRARGAAAQHGAAMTDPTGHRFAGRTRWARVWWATLSDGIRISG